MENIVVSKSLSLIIFTLEIKSKRVLVEKIKFALLRVALFVSSIRIFLIENQIFILRFWETPMRFTPCAISWTAPTPLLKWNWAKIGKKVAAKNFRFELNQNVVYVWFFRNKIKSKRGWNFLVEITKNVCLFHCSLYTIKWKNVN